mgnify:FL=1
MKKILLLLFGIVFSLSVEAQSNITIGLVMPSEELNGIKPDAFSLLQSKLDKVLTNSGVATNGGDFVLYPIVNIIEESLIEGGIKNFYKVKIDLTLNVANLSTKTVFSSASWPLVGTSERVKSDAVRNAFSQLKSTDPSFKAFLETTKGKICEYYENNKSAIFTQATALANTGKYDEAMAMLLNYPSQVSGYDESQQLMQKIYLQYIESNAARILNEARAAYATKDYETAVNLAAQIPSESSHYNEAKSIIDQVRLTINKEQSEKNARIMKSLEIAADVEKTRINAVASVARQYYSRRVVNYNVVRIY